LTFDGGGYEVMYIAGPTNMHQFKYISPTDRSASVFFDLEFESVSSQSWIQSDIDMRNALYVGGQGEGVNRLIIGVIPASGNPVGLERREAFVDARDLSTTDAVTARGNAILEQMIEDNRFTATLYERGSFRYGVHFFLGDIITLKNAKWNLSVQSRVISATLNWTDTEQPSIVLELDRPWPTIKERMQQEAYGLSQVSPKGAVDYHSENHMVRHQRGGADEFLFNPVQITGANLNALTWTSGFYSLVNATNAPSAEVYWHLYVNRWPDAQGYMSQIASPILDPTKLYYRGYNVSTATWSPWAEIGSSINKLWQGTGNIFTASNIFRGGLLWGLEDSRGDWIPSFNATNIPSGFYAAGDIANAPKPGYLWNIIHVTWPQHSNYTNNYVIQFANSIHDPSVSYMRICTSGTWTTWRKTDNNSNTGGWYTIGSAMLGTNSNTWDITIPSYTLYNAMIFEVTFYTVANYSGNLSMEPLKNQAIYNPGMSMIQTKYLSGVAPVTVQAVETAGIRFADGLSICAMDYGQFLNVQFSSINGLGLMEFTGDLYSRDPSLTPAYWRTMGTQRGSHVGGSLSGMRLSITSPAQFHSQSVCRVIGRRAEIHAV
jgi:hypothetical protein